MGPHEQQLIEKATRMHRPIPKAILEAPELDLGLEFVYSSFWTLSACRPIGFAPGPISWSVSVEFAEWHDLSREEIEDFLFLIRAMDKAFLEYHSQELKEASKTPTVKA